MKRIDNLYALVLVLFGIMLGILMSGLYVLQFSKDEKYYDGEGNVIPTKVVHLLVKDQFVHMTAEEDSLIKQYFYFR
jgi:hypothetical protein